MSLLLTTAACAAVVLQCKRTRKSEGGEVCDAINNEEFRENGKNCLINNWLTIAWLPGWEIASGGWENNLFLNSTNQWHRIPDADAGVFGFCSSNIVHEA